MSGVSQMPLLAGSSASVVFAANAEDGTAQTTYTFASQNFGTAAGNRYLVASFSHRAAGPGITGSSVTIGGVAATQIASVSNGNGRGELWIALVPTGASGTVSITWSGGAARTVLGLWAVSGIQSPTPTNTYSSVASPLTDSVNCQAGGVVVAGGFANVSATATWAGLTKNYDNTNASGCISSGACAAFATAQSGLTVSMTGSVALTPDPVMCVAAFR